YALARPAAGPTLRFPAREPRASRLLAAPAQRARPRDASRSRHSCRLQSLQDGCYELEVGDEGVHLSVARVVVTLTQDRARVDRRRHVRREVRLDPAAPLLRHAELLAEQRLRRGRAQTDDDVGLHHRELRVEPRPARGLLAPRRLRVDPPLASRLPLEMLNRIRHVRRGAVDTGELERLVQQAPGRADERAPRAILLVARLLADEDDARVVGALAEHRLRPRLPERAAPAAGGRVAGAPAASGAREGRARPFSAHRCVSLTRGIRSLPLFAKLGPRMVVRPAPYLRVLPEEGHAAPELVESYRRLADVFHELLAEQSL